MVFAYIRVSTKDQNTDRQAQSINEYAAEKNITIDRVYEEKASGKDFNREAYKALKLTLRKGDTIIIKELDRLGRNMSEIKDEWHEFNKMGVDIIVLDNELLSTANKNDLEKMLIGDIVFAVFSYMAEKEREKIRSRQAEGIAIAKTKGKYKGRKPIQRDNFDIVYNSWKNDEITAVKAMETLNVSKSTFYRRVRAIERKQQPESSLT